MAVRKDVQKAALEGRLTPMQAKSIFDRLTDALGELGVTGIDDTFEAIDAMMEAILERAQDEGEDKLLESLRIFGQVVEDEEDRAIGRA